MRRRLAGGSGWAPPWVHTGMSRHFSSRVFPNPNPKRTRGVRYHVSGNWGPGSEGDVRGEAPSGVPDIDV